MKLKAKRILEYYDYPQLFVAENVISSLYLCLLVNELSEGLEYLATPISHSRLYDLETNSIDLRLAFEKSELNEYYTFTLDHDSEESFDISIYPGPITDMLPEKGLFIGNRNYNTQLKKIAVKENKTIYALHLMEKGKRKSVSGTMVSAYVSLTQKLIKNAYVQAVKNISKEIRARINEMNASQMDVFAFGEGSLVVLFSTNAYVDMFGNSDDELFVSKVKELISIDYKDIEKMKDVFRKNKGHFVSAIEQLCKRVVENEMPYEVSYASANDKSEGILTIDIERAKAYNTFINTEEELTQEIVVFTAIFVQADVEKGNWRIKLEDGKEITGKSSGDLLFGIILKEASYSIRCEEIIVEDSASGEEKKQYKLLSCDRIV